jgi:putative hydrolase of the HAD superfamily
MGEERRYMTRRRGVIWDFDGTLAERPGLWSGCLLEVLDAEDPGHGLRREDIAAHMRTGFPWHTPDRTHLELCDPDTWWDEVIGLLTTVYLRVGYSRRPALRFAAQVRTRYVDGAVRWRVFPDAHDALRRLHREGCRQAILSNHAPELPLLVEQLGLSEYFRSIITSARTGFEKPHPSAYAAAAQSLSGVTQLWMVGDSPEADYHGPQRHGIRGVLVWRKEEPLPDNVTTHVKDLMSAVDFILADPLQRPDDIVRDA